MRKRRKASKAAQTGQARTGWAAGAWTLAFSLLFWAAAAHADQVTLRSDGKSALDAGEWTWTGNELGDQADATVATTTSQNRELRSTLGYDAILDGASISQVDIYLRADGTNEAIDWGPLIGGTDYLSGTAVDTSTTMSDLGPKSWTTNPDTGLAWTDTDIQGLEVVAQSKNKGGWSGTQTLAEIWIVVTYTPGTGNTPPTASAGNITGQDNPQHAGIEYQVTSVYSDADGAADLADLHLRLDHEAVTDVELSVTQGTADTGNATVVSGSAFLIGTPTYSKTEGASDITVTWTYTLDWDWTESTLIEYGVRATDDAAADSGFDNTNIDIRYENDLTFSGSVAVSGAVNGAVACGTDWVQGLESLTWTGLTVVYEGSGVSPLDGDFDIQITDDDTGSWTQSTGAALNLVTTSDVATDTSDNHNVDIIGIPSGGSAIGTPVTCEIKVDADAPETVASVAAGSPTASSITVSWTPYGGGDTGAVGASGFQTYRVYYDTSPGVSTADPFWDAGDDAALSNSGTSSTTVTGLASDTPYWFRVLGRDEAENQGNLSTEATETTTAGPNNPPTASAANITGQDNPQHAGVEYQVTAVYSDADGFDDLATVYSRLDHPTATDIELSVSQGPPDAGNATVASGGAFLIGTPTFSKVESGNDITVTWTYTLDWDWVESTAIEYGVRAEDDQAADSGWSNTSIGIRYEKDLEFSGTLAVSGADNGAVACGTDWVHGLESLTWTGLTVVYQDSGVSPADADFNIQITDDDTGSWTQNTGADLNLGTTSDIATDTSDVHNVDIIGIPSGGSAIGTPVPCEIKVDADAPETLGGVAAGGPTSSSITVSWTPYGGGDTGAVGASGFQTYRVYYDTSAGVTTADPVWDSGNDSALSISGTATTTITGLSPDTPYFFRVVGRDEAENEGSVPGADEVTASTDPASGDSLTASENTPIRALDPEAGETGLVMQRFKVASDGAGDGDIELSSVTVEDLGTVTTGEIAEVEIYIDVDLGFSGAQLIGNDATFSAEVANTIPLDGGTVADRTVTAASPKYIFVVYDLGTAGPGDQILSRVSAVGVVGPPDTGATGLAFDSNTLTVIAAAQLGTTVSGSTASVTQCSLSGSSTGQITVFSRFTGDDDDDGWVEVRYETSPTVPDGTSPIACATATGPSPRQCLVSGLAPGTYNLRVDFFDGDGVGGATDPQFLNGNAVPACGADTSAPTVLILSPWRDAIIGGTEKVRVQVYDQGGGLTAADLDWAVDAGTLANTGVGINGGYDCGTDCSIFEFDLNTTAVNGGLTDDSHYLVIQVDDGTHVSRVEQAFRVRNLGATPGGSGQLLRRSPGSRLCLDCHDLPTHSSQTTSTKYGTWAMACNDCHTPHGTTNIFLLREEIRTPNSGTRSVRFENQSGAADVTVDAGGAASFVNEDAFSAGSPAAVDGPCQVCHTRTQASDGKERWRNFDQPTPNADNHYDFGRPTQKCTGCHSHGAGFSGAGGGGCTGCHFGSNSSAVQAGRRDVQIDFGKRSHHVGTPGGTMDGLLTDYDCVVCHAEGTITNGETATTADFHNDGDCSGSHCIDLKDVDNWDNANPATSPVFRYDKQRLIDKLSGGTAGTTPGNWGSGDADWEEETSERLDPFCLTCHDFNGAVASRNEDSTTDNCASADPLNPFCDGTISNDYDQYDRGRVTDIASRAARAWRASGQCSITTSIVCNLDTMCPSGETCVSGGSYSAGDRDQSGEPRYDESPAGADGIADPPLGVYSRHAIRGVAVTGGFSGSASVYANATDANGDIPTSRWVQTNFTWEDNSVMGCADCHTVDGANHTDGNAHGSNSEYLLKDANGLATLGVFSGKSYNCYRCHSPTYYDYGATVQTRHTDNSSDWVNTAGNDAPDRSAANGNIFGIACMNCHGGVESGTQGPTAPGPGPIEFGTIHGTSQIYGIGENGDSGLREAYRFMNGNSLRYFNPNGWSNDADNTISCYTIDGNEEDSFGACSQHSKQGKVFTKLVPRDLKY